MAATYAPSVTPAAMEYARQGRIIITRALEALDGTEHPALRNALFAAYDKLGEVNPANE